MTATDQAALLRLARHRAGTGQDRTASPAAFRGEGPAPLSHAQQRMWLMDRLGQGGALYNVPLATRLRGPLDTAALAEALTALTARHTVLRTRYGQRGDQPFQEVGPADPVPLPVVPAETAQTPELLAAEAARPFDLAAGPVLRALLLRHGPEDHILLLTLHHIAVDGGSLPVLGADLAALYQAARTGGPAGLAEVETQYADYARWERARDAELTAAADRRAAALTGARGTALLRPVPPGARTRQAGLHTAPLTTATLDGLRRLGTEHGATLFAVVLAAAFATLRTATGEPDLTVGCAGGHRARPELRRLVGLGVNTLPIRAELPGDPAFTEVLGLVRAALLDAQAHHDVPFDLILERLGAAARDADGNPLLAVSCDLIRPAEPLALPGLTAEAVEIDLGLAKFGLALLVEEGPQPRCLVQHDTAALDEPTARRLLTAFAELLTAVAADPARLLGDLPGTRLTAATDGAAAAATDTVAAADAAAGEPAARETEHPAVAALLADPRVAEAAVLAPEGGPVIAFAVVRGPDAPSGLDLRTALRRRVPANRLPAAVTLVDALPRQADGSVDQARLPGAGATPAGGSEPLDTVRAAFGELLGTTPQPDGDFFALGGHSLVAVQLAERLRIRTGLPLTGLDVLEQRTPRALAVLLDARAAERRAAPGRPSDAGRRPARAGTVLLTGATGGVGAAVLQELLAQGRPVRALARPESAHLLARQGVEVAEGDLADLDSLRRAVGGVDTVIHAACTFTEHATDLAAMRTLLDGWQGGDFVFVGSIDAYGRPTATEVPEGGPAEQPVSPYGQAKLDCERLLLEAVEAGRGRGAVVRSPIVWGPHRRLRDQLRWGSTGALYQAASAGETLVLPAPEADGPDWYGASWVHSAALARAVTGCADGTGRASGRIVNAVTGHVSWPELAGELVRLLGSSSVIELRADAEPELRRPWRYRADALADLLRPEPGEDWRSVLAAMVERRPS
ncbi:condensation domain-containing protein [Kitasatospora sp. NPDC058170]|uniref:condensation domain-containing protein n=1 Tax=Kitasatospora sp. NPDC058170 TaxID=3346364 RepID=UPI0036DE6C52